MGGGGGGGTGGIEGVCECVGVRGDSTRAGGGVWWTPSLNGGL